LSGPGVAAEGWPVKGLFLCLHQNYNAAIVDANEKLVKELKDGKD